MIGQPVTIYEVVPAPTAQTTIADVAVGAVVAVASLIAVALFLGLLYGGLLIVFRRIRRRKHPDDMHRGSDVTRLDLTPL